MEYCSRDGSPLPLVAAATQLDLSTGLSGRYRIVRRLGEGGMGTVFLAEQITVGSRSVALKILRRNLLEDPEFLRRFQDEAASTGRIHHQNVVTLYECGQSDNGSPYIAMEYLEGESLRQYLRREGSIPLETVSEILLQAGRGLNAAHKLGIVHRDLKPDNIFLTHDDDGKLLVKIVDFGIAKMRESTTHTMTGLAVGTPIYMSVEQASGMRSEQIDGRSDIYSLGIVVYEMIAGSAPFHADTPLAYVQKHLTQPPLPLSVTRPDLNIPPQVEHVVMRALSKNREDRYSTAVEFARAFAEAATGRIVTPAVSTNLNDGGSYQNAPQPQALTPAITALNAIATAPVAAHVPVASRSRLPAILLVCAAAVVLALGAAAWYLLSSKRESTPPVSPGGNVAASATPKPQGQAPSAPVTPTLPVQKTTASSQVPPSSQSLNRAIELMKMGRYSEALPVLQRSANSGNAEAERYLADMYLNGSGVAQNYEQARRWYERAAHGGNIAAMTDLGHIYDYGWGVPQDYVQARQWYEKASAFQNAVAMADLGRLYQDGRGVPQDYGQARQWYERAAAAGSRPAMLNLGHMYEHGWGVAQNYAQARQWYERSAAAGNPAAASDLARLAGLEAANRNPAPDVRNQSESSSRLASPKAAALLKKARAEWQLGNHDEAFADVSSAISDSPAWPAPYLFRAEWEASTGNARAALADYTACIERKPIPTNLIAAYSGRAKLKERLGDKKGAEADSDEARKVKNTDR